jgi:hypothetical protein
MQSLTLISGFSMAFTSYMVIGLAANHPTGLLYAISVPASFLFGVL